MSTAGNRLGFGPFRLDPRERLLLRDGRPVALTPKAFDLLVHLVQRPGNLVEKHELMAAIWPDTVVEETNLAYNVSALRKALGEGQDGEQFIQTVPTRGYRFVAPVQVHEIAEGRPGASSTRRRVLVTGSLTAAAAAAGLGVWWLLWPQPELPRVVRFELPAVSELRGLTTLAISRDGDRIVYAAQSPGSERQLYLRSLDSLKSTPLPGTLGGHHPFFSPDGRSIGFIARGSLSTLNLTTGQTANLQAEKAEDATWAEDGNIYYSRFPGHGIARIAGTGGTPRPVTTLAAGELVHGSPELLPDGRHLMFGVVRSDNFDDVGTEVVSLVTGARRTVLEGRLAAKFLPTGHLVYVAEGSLMAVKFDPQSLEVSGEPIRVLEGIATDLVALFSVSRNGTLVYYPGGPLPKLVTEVVRLDSGGAQPILSPRGLYVDPSISADDNYLAVSARFGTSQDIWVHDFERRMWTRVTTGVEDEMAPVWHPVDPNKVVYTATRTGFDEGLALMAVRADGSNPGEILYQTARPLFASSASPASGLVAFTQFEAKTKGDIWLLDLRGKPAARPFLQTSFDEKCGALSPDGRWIAYESDESGQPEVYVRRVAGDSKQRLSPDGGDRPRWSRDGRRIAYRSGRRLMTVTVKAGTLFAAETPRLLAEGDFAQGGFATPNYDIRGDGQILTMIRPVPQPSSRSLVVVQNWFTELRHKLGQ